MSSLEARIPNNFEGGGAQYIPIGGLYSVNGADEPAIGQYTERAPSTGTYVLGSINGIIQWIATESCDE
jgi:hypothetical protein